MKINSAQNNTKKFQKTLNRLKTTEDAITKKKKKTMKLVSTLFSKVFLLIIRFFKS
jgi:hypothetical protein